MSEQNTATAPAAATATPAAAPAAPAVTKKEKVIIKTTLGLAGAKIKRVTKVKGEDGKFIKDAEGKVVTTDVISSYAYPTVAPDKKTIDDPAAFIAFLEQFFKDVTPIEGAFATWLDRHKIISWFEDCSESAQTQQADGKSTLSREKYFDALYHGAPRSVNTLSSVNEELTKCHVEFSEMQLAATMYKDQPAELLKAAAEFECRDLAAFATKLMDTQKRLMLLKTKLSTLKAAKAQREAEKAQAALAAPAPAK